MLCLVLSCFVLPRVESSGSEVGRVRDSGKSVGACEDEREKERKREREKERKKEREKERKREREKEIKIESAFGIGRKSCRVLELGIFL